MVWYRSRNITCVITAIVVENLISYNQADYNKQPLMTVLHVSSLQRPLIRFSKIPNNLLYWIPRGVCCTVSAKSRKIISFANTNLALDLRRHITLKL